MTNRSRSKEISIGWDVGGWSGKNHGFSVLLSEANQLQLLKAVKLNVFEVKENIESILEKYLPTHSISIGIDAPLQFPSLFKEVLLSNPINVFDQVQKQSKENPIAWRATDLYIKKYFSKTPLSASFSFLSSNATVAISLIGELKAKFNELAVLPFDSQSTFNAIEVYPGLLKSPKLNESSLLGHYKKLIKQLEIEHLTGFDYYFDDAKEKSDVADGVICGLYALGLNSADVAPPLEMAIPNALTIAAKNEGWIYYPRI